MIDFVYCDKCGVGFVVQIKKTQILIGAKVLLLEYFACPSCGKVYKILLVDERKYMELVDDSNKIVKRIEKLQGKKDYMLLDKLQKMEEIKKMRIKRYVSNMFRKYAGFFICEKDQDGERIIYISKGE